MRFLRIALLVFLSGTYGFALSSQWHAHDYSNGYQDGYGAGVIATRPLRDTDRVVNNLLCHYAEVACPKLK